MELSSAHSALTVAAVVVGWAAPLAAQSPNPQVPATAPQVAAADPVADPAATVVEGHARFTLLTPRLIRMEWSADGHFEDRASLVFIQRRLPVPHQTARRAGGWLTIRTDDLTLRYRQGSGRFSAQNLEVRLRVDGRDVVWHPGEADSANLKGTTRTLDGAKGPVPLEPGLLSRAGWTVVDDSQRPLFDHAAWPWVVARASGERQDLYFFGYGHDYKGALADFITVAGRMPMPPRFAFGDWWSRYWAYTDQEFMDLVRQFNTFDVPLDVLVIDMDWHKTFELRWENAPKDQAGQTKGWTGYSWNPAYFPDPEAFLAWTAQQGLRTPLNLHPAGGIEPWETHYPEMARDMGLDPATERYVPFRPTNRQFVDNYFKDIIAPLEHQGVDFWWLDWQQWDTTAVAGLNPTWWINYVFFTHMKQEGKARPLIFHRWGGLGNHRYEIGFSGDAYSTWNALAFEPYFTATAANVGFGYWSHDIGGHLNGEVSPELYTRWIQFGIFSPILRTHTTKNPNAERRIWAYPTEYFRVMRQDYMLRYAMIPYIYTAARHAYDTGVALVHPLYYDWPEDSAAYDLPDEYAFGPDMIVRPVTAPMSPDTLLATQHLWLPPGDWYEWFTGARLKGPAVVTRTFALNDVPVYVRAGAIVPMATTALRSDAQPKDLLALAVFPGDSGSTRVYQDAGKDLGYQTGAFAWTPVRQRRDADGTLQLTIGPTTGDFPGLPARRGYVIRLIGRWPPRRVLWNDREIPYAGDAPGDSTAPGRLTIAAAAGGPDPESVPAAPGWTYDGNRLSVVIHVPPADIRTTATLDVQLPADQNDSLLNGVPATLSRLERAMHILEGLWSVSWPPDSLVALQQTGHRITLHPDRAAAELEHLRGGLPAVLDKIRTLHGDSTLIRKALAQLGG
jgi:Glycosyl hydrolases family 31 TIM-barrel domain/Glycosyl hydrolase family 31 C-terminal domain/Domain of unknown function (DUF5110)